MHPTHAVHAKSTGHAQHTAAQPPRAAAVCGTRRLAAVAPLATPRAPPPPPTVITKVASCRPPGSQDGIITHRGALVRYRQQLPTRSSAHDQQAISSNAKPPAQSQPSHHAAAAHRSVDDLLKHRGAVIGHHACQLHRQLPVGGLGQLCLKSRQHLAVGGLLSAGRGAEHASERVGEGRQKEYI